METENSARPTAPGVKPAAAVPIEGRLGAAAGTRLGGGRAALGDVALNSVRGGAAKPVAAPAVPPRAASVAGAGAAFAGFVPAPVAAAPVSLMDTSLDSAFDLPAGVVDVDADDAEDPACVSEYAREIYSHQRADEAERTAKFGYMVHQSDINEKMRAILMDWLEEVHLKFKLMPETMFLTHNIIDRFLERKLVVRSKLQLVGVTAMLLASKYEEIYAPEVRDFVYITDKAYTREQILQMEATMLNTLDFRISVPTVFVFLNRFLKVAGADPRLTQLATFVVERMLQEYRMLQHLPSRIAAAAVNVAMRSLHGRAAWNETMRFHSGYSEAELRPTIVDIQDFLAGSAASSLQAVRKKYASPKFGEVVGIPIAPLDY